MYRKVIIIAVILCLVFASSCKNTPQEPADEGKISKIEKQDKEVKTDDSRKLFKVKEEPFGYAYTPHNIMRASMSVKIPNGWNTEVKSSREIRITPGEKYQKFENTGLHMMFNYEPSLWGRDETIDTTYKAFAYEIPAAQYHTVNGTYFTDMNYDLNNIVEDAEWCNKKGCILYAENTDALIRTKFGAAPDMIAIYYFVKWSKDVFMCFSAVTPKDNKEDTRLLMEYIISSMKYIPHKIDSMQEITLSGYTMKVPSSLMADKNDKTIAYDTVKNTNLTSGISVMCAKTDEELIDEKIDGALGIALARKMLPEISTFDISPVITDSYNVTIDKKPARCYECNIAYDIVSSGNTLPTVYPINIPTNYYMKIYDLKDTGKILGLMYQDGQADIGKIIETSIKNGKMS